MSVRQAIRSAFSLEEGSASPEEIRQSILSGAHVKGTNLCILVLAILIASIGLNMNSTAVIIGAMLISPLMGGIMAVGYGFALGDLRLSRRAFIGLLFQVIVCIVASTLYFSRSPVCGGLAGIIGVTRKEKTNVIPGVAIATALMPPLCTAGYGLATRSLSFFLGAMYLFFINGFFICVSTFVVVRLMRLPRQEFLSSKRHSLRQLLSRQKSGAPQAVFPAAARRSLFFSELVQPQADIDRLIHPALVGRVDPPGLFPQPTLVQRAHLLEQDHAVLGKAAAGSLDADMGRHPVFIQPRGDGRRDHGGAVPVAHIILDDKYRPCPSLFAAHHRAEIGIKNLSAFDFHLKAPPPVQNKKGCCASLQACTFILHRGGRI